MRRLVAALVVVAVAFAVAGCSDGGSPAPAASAAPPATPVAAAPAAVPASPAGTTTPVSATNVLSPRQPGSGQAFPNDKNVPDAVKKRLASHQPMLILFYDPNQPSSNDQRGEIDIALKQYRGLIDLVAFDVTGALPDPVTGKVTKEKGAEQAALLVQELGIGFTPYVVLVDKQGMVTGRYRGFIDRVLLQREILKATQ